MDPLSAIIIALCVAGYFTRNVYQDSVFKARGEDPPSYRRQQERLQRRAAKTRTPITDRQEARRFWVNAWEDAWESAEERRARAREKAAERRRGRWRDEDLAAAEDEAYERNRAQDEADKPQPAAEPEPAEPTPADEPSSPATPEPQPAAPQPPSAPPGDTVADPVPTAENVVWPAAWHKPQTTSPNQGEPMSAESHNLAAALAYTEAMAAKCREGVASAEQSIAGMASGGVTGAPIAAVQSAMEALTTAANHFETAHAELTNHIQVREAYQANQDAGEKQYVTTE